MARLNFADARGGQDSDVKFARRVCRRPEQGLQRRPGPCSFGFIKDIVPIADMVKKGFSMLRSLSNGTILAALTLMWLAAAWIACDMLFADPAVLVFEDLAILCAVLAPITYLIGWAMRWLSLRLSDSGAARRA